MWIKAKLASTLEPAKVLESLQNSDSRMESLSHMCLMQYAQVVSHKEYLGSDHGLQTSDLPLNEVPTMHTDQVTNLLSDHTKELAIHWNAQLANLTSALKPSHANTVFSGKLWRSFTEIGCQWIPELDVNEFLANFEKKLVSIS